MRAGESDTLAAQLIAALGSGTEPGDVDRDALNQDLADAVAHARAAWPEVRTTPEEYVRFLAGRIDAGADLRRAVDGLALVDLWLSCAVLAGDDDAIRTFVGLVDEVAALAMRRARLEDDGGRELAQAMRALLIVGDGAQEPLLKQYRGTGSLRGWLRVALLRRGLRMKMRRNRMAPLGEQASAALLAAPLDPELEHLKRHYREEFRVAFRTALEGLAARDKRVLRYYLVERLTIAQIGGIYGAHRTSVARWIAQAKKRVFRLTMGELKVRLSVEAQELESIIRLVRSSLDASLSPLYADPGEDNYDGVSD